MQSNYLTAARSAVRLRRPASRSRDFAELKGYGSTAAAEAAVAAVARAGLTFPLLCKPAVACGPRGHRLSLVLRAEGLTELVSSASADGPLIAQEYVDHGGSVLKAYAVGDLEHLALKPSLPDLAPLLSSEEGGGLAQPPALVHIDSQRPLDSALHALGVQPTMATEAASSSSSAALAPAPAAAVDAEPSSSSDAAANRDG